MIVIEKIDVFGFDGALRGMRNALDSWDKADSLFFKDGSIKNIGANDIDLMSRLTRSGRSHRKFLRMIHVQMDITAPLYWWKDYDTYKVGTVANSCSTMHKIHAYEFKEDMFSTDHLDQIGRNVLASTIDYLNYYRNKYLESNKKDKESWYRMIQLLPTSYMQKRTVDLSYEVILAILQDRSYHKLDEFRELCMQLRKTLPYMDDLYNIGINNIDMEVV